MQVKQRAVATERIVASRRSEAVGGQDWWDHLERIAFHKLWQRGDHGGILRGKEKVHDHDLHFISASAVVAV